MVQIIRLSSTPEDQVVFDAAKRRFLLLKQEWESLGFWARIWRAREFRCRFDVVIQVLKLYGRD